MEQPRDGSCPSPTCRCRTAPPESVLSVRSAVLLVLSIVIGFVIGWLAFVAYGNVAGAAIAGMGAFGCVLVAANALVR
ncbi:hypothetical protein ABZ345_32560 [Lentzea sp. NPDC005914]|uniref:hypothetical protein n=1 Tax=Lentzea sp. NPDC005914 TaxID=3154572 RepID=UPI0033CABAE4